VARTRYSSITSGGISVTSAAKMSQQSSNEVVPARNSHSTHHCGRTILYEIFERIENMVISAVLFIGVVLATGAAIVKAYEWHQDMLYGPYLKPMD
jgi:alanine dehydrogenase